MELHSLQFTIVQYLILLLSLSFHEYGHAWMAHKMGDRTPLEQGRLSLNPLVHMDLFGTVLFPLFMMLFPSSLGIWGWAKPVEVNPKNLKKGGGLWVTLAGPFSHLFLGLCAAIISIALSGHYEPVARLMTYAVFINCILFIFNMIPIPPLDGSFLLVKVLHVRQEIYLYLAQWGFVILVILLQINGFRYLIHIFASGVMRILYLLAEFCCWPFQSFL